MSKMICLHCLQPSCLHLISSIIGRENVQVSSHFYKTKTFYSMNKMGIKRAKHAPKATSPRYCKWKQQIFQWRRSTTVKNTAQFLNDGLQNEWLFHIFGCEFKYCKLCFEFVPTPFSSGGVGMYINKKLDYSFLE